uniref:Ribosomal protein S4 n=1 Tax=Panagrolaimus sp. JU765 TaxID=591449 RepID=A0AC34QWI2_9BILA
MSRSIRRYIKNARIRRQIEMEQTRIQDESTFLSPFPGTSLQTLDECLFLHSSAPSLDEIHDSTDLYPSLRAPKRPNDLPGISSVQNLPTFEETNPALSDSQIYTTFHQYFIPPNEKRVPRAVANLSPPPPYPQSVVVEKMACEIKRATWINKFFFGANDLMILRTVRVKVPTASENHYNRLTFDELCRIKSAQINEKITIFSNRSKLR